MLSDLPPAHQAPPERLPPAAPFVMPFVVPLPAMKTRGLSWAVAMNDSARSPISAMYLSCIWFSSDSVDSEMGRYRPGNDDRHPIRTGRQRYVCAQTAGCFGRYTERFLVASRGTAMTRNLIWLLFQPRR